MHLLRGFGGIFLRQPAESREHPSEPDNHEHQEASEDVPHPGNIGPVIRMQIGLNRIIERDDQEDRAAEPGKIGVQKGHGLRQVFRRKPILFIRPVDQLRRHGSNDPRNPKSQHGCKYTHASEKSEEG